MLNFKEYPKQFIITRAEIKNIDNCKREKFGHLNIYTSESVYISKGNNIDGVTFLILGWPIFETRILSNEQLNLKCSIEEFYKLLSGRFILITKSDNGIEIRTDANGFMPLVYYIEKYVIASSPAVIKSVYPLQENKEIKSIFNFPQKRGFLPFGLTNYIHVKRLLPNHILKCEKFEVSRFWPTSSFIKQERINDEEQLFESVRTVASKVENNVYAIIRKSSDKGYLYLSGGKDSRMVLASSIRFKDKVICETITGKYTPDLFLAKKICKQIGVLHESLELVKSSREEVYNWLDRTGYTFYDPLTELSASAKKFDHNCHSMDGTGAELFRASNWSQNDCLKEKYLSVDTLLKGIRMPKEDILINAAEDWLNSFPEKLDVPLGMDLAKIEQIHACWAGNSAYGHLTSYPTISPFSGQLTNEIAVKLPVEYKLNSRFVIDYISFFSKDLLKIPFNKATGLSRLRFLKYELKNIVPKEIKMMIKPLR